MAGDWRQLDYNESRAFEENADRGKRTGPPGADRRRLHRLRSSASGAPARRGTRPVGRWSDRRLDQFVERLGGVTSAATSGSRTTPR